jgi:hypothetical protein
VGTGEKLMVISKPAAHLSLLYYILWICVPPSLLLAVAMFITKFTTHPSNFTNTSTAYLWTFLCCPVSIAIGFWLARRIPGNLVAPALILWGVSCSVWIQPENPQPSPILAVWMFTIGLPAGMMLFVYFPDGKASPNGWERLYACYFVVNAIICVLFLFSNATSDTVVFTISRPHDFFIPALAPLAGITTFLMNMLIIPIWILLPLPMVLRYRRATFTVKRQMKWLLWLTVVAVLVFVPVMLWDSLLKPFDTLGILAPYSVLRSTLYTYFQLTPAFSILFAILRHKLYDIDIIIRRTLIYSVLTGVLGVIYFGGVIITQQLFQAVTGDTPDIAIVLSTLLIAALFNPIRNRIQDVIDRRLYRRKYDVEQTLAQFNQSLRNEVDVKTLQANLIGVVSDTMQPDKIALWVKEK